MSSGSKIKRKKSSTKQKPPLRRGGVNVNEEEKKALSLHRLVNWIKTYEQALTDLQKVQHQLQESAGMAVYALLEAKEERERLKALGLADEQIDRVARMPNIPSSMSTAAIVAAAGPAPAKSP